MIENLNDTDRLILTNLVCFPENRGAASLALSFDIAKSHTYTIQRLEYLQHRGLVFRSRRGKSVLWLVRPKLRKQIAETLGLPWSDVKKKLKAQAKKSAAAEADKVFGWEGTQ